MWFVLDLFPVYKGRKADEKLFDIYTCDYYPLGDMLFFI